MNGITTFSGLLLITTMLFNSCGQSEQKVSNTIDSEVVKAQELKEIDPNASPENVMNTIFNAAQSGEVGVLKFLLPPVDSETGEMPCDGDCKALCNPGNESMKEELGHNYISLSDFKDYFSNAKIIGSPEIEGQFAKVQFVFGPNREKSETMNLQKMEGKWYLSSF